MHFLLRLKLLLLELLLEMLMMVLILEWWWLLLEIFLALFVVLSRVVPSLTEAVVALQWLLKLMLAQRFPTVMQTIVDGFVLPGIV